VPTTAADVDVAALLRGVGLQLPGKGKAPVVAAAVLPGHDPLRLAFSHRGGSMVRTN
jgi:hypothetical protein